VDTPTSTVTPQPAKPYQPFQKQTGELTVGDWMITLLVSFIPIVNIVMMFVWAFGSNTNPSKANWAKATLIWMAIGVVLAILFMVIIGTAIFHGMQSYE
jgi:heme/copper-type cytochrome/quinol oxidase subunit 2